MHYLDLPVLARQPSVLELRSALKALEQDETTNFEETGHLDKGTKQWLSRLASADLSYLSESDAEEIRAAASRRVAQECGVTASAAKFRSVTFGEGPDSVIQLHEPGMTEDQLGKLTWGSSLVLARRLGNNPLLVKDKVCIELGAGTGLCSIAAAKLGAKRVHATDLPEIVPNLAENVEINHVSDVCSSYTLDWSKLPTEPSPKTDICIVSDPVYSKDHPPMLLRTVRWVNSPCVLLQLPLRKGFEPERQQIYDGLSETYHQVDYEEETGRDLFGEQKFAYSRWVI